MKFKSGKINIVCGVIMFSWERQGARDDMTQNCEKSASDEILYAIGCRVRFLDIFQAVF